MQSNDKTAQLEAFQRFIGRCDATDDKAEVYLQGEDYEIKRVSLPTLCYFMVFRFLETHHQGRAPSHIDRQAKGLCADNPGLSYDEAVIGVLDEFIATPGFIKNVRAALDNQERDWRDSGDFKAVQAARDEHWRRANNAWGDKPLPAHFH